MKIVKIPLSDLKKPDRNVRLHTDKQLNEFVRSVEMFGQIRPIVTDENNIILAGNGLYEALKRMGRDKADVLKIPNLSENQKKKLMLADNKIFGLGMDDLESFDAILEDLKNDLDIPGFDEDLLRSMVADASEITEQLREYGTLDADEIAELHAARERKEALIQAARENANQPDNSNGGGNAEPDGAANIRDGAENDGGHDNADNEGREVIRRSVICPHCGGTVWL